MKLQLGHLFYFIPRILSKKGSPGHMSGHLTLALTQTCASRFMDSLLMTELNLSLPISTWKLYQ